jgi:hypothetical protein
MEVKVDRKFFHVAGDKNLAACIKDNEKDGFRLNSVIWTGNLDAKIPGQVLTAKGEDARSGIIHLYLVLFLREVPVEAGPKIVN